MQKLVTVMCLLGIMAVSIRAADDGFKPLFNGTDLTGWDGNTKLWSAKEGVIIGETTKENPTKGNTFLIFKGGESKGELKDFELKFSFRMSTTGNSGVQFRSKDLGNFVMKGYQYDFNNAGFPQMGKLYDEKGDRGYLALNGEKVAWDNTTTVKTKVVTPLPDLENMKTLWKKGDWNDGEIIATGNHIIQKLNGVIVVDFTDNNDTKKLLSGWMGIQIHAGAPMKIEMKNILLKEIK
ncbi:MAG: DUF1080 domain-containing protein [Planctomycetota bacterium]